MTSGRTLNKYARVYVDGYDVSGYARSLGPLSVTFQEGVDDPLNVAVVGTWLGQGTISPGTLNSLFDNTSDTGIHALLQSSHATRDVMEAIGIQADPAQGDPVFMAQPHQLSYEVDPAATPSAVTVRFVGTAGDGVKNYHNPWGVLLHANTAVTTDNTAIGVDLAGLGFGTSDASTDGGYMMYQITAGVAAGGTAALKVQDASTNENADFTDLLSTGSIDVGTAPVSGVVELATTASVRQFIRWQVAFGTATSVTFLLGFCRGRPR